MTVNLDYDTPERMIAIWKEQIPSASPEYVGVLRGLIEKWRGWHGAVFRRVLEEDKKIACGGDWGLKLGNYAELRPMVIFV